MRCSGCAAQGGFLPRSARWCGRSLRGLSQARKHMMCQDPPPQLLLSCLAQARVRLALTGADVWGRAHWSILRADASGSIVWLPSKWFGNSLATALFPSPGSFLIELLLDLLIFI